MEKENDKNIIDLRKRFASDYNLPIQLFHSPFFEERLKLSDSEYNSSEKYNSLINLINSNYKKNPSLFLEYYYKVRDDIITKINESQAFKDFNESDVNNIYHVDLPECPKKDIYTEDMTGKMLLSIDLRKANYQALKYVNPNIVFNTSSYEDLINLFTNLEYIKESKYTRQVIFGKLNPKKTIHIEKYIMDKINTFINENGYIGALDGELMTIASDELIYEINLNNYQVKDIVEDISNTIKEDLKLDVKVEIFKIEPIQFIIPFSESTLTIYKKKNLLDNTFKFKKTPMIYYPQIVKLLSNKKITKNDLIFFSENQLVSFIEPIKLKFKDE